MDLTAFVGKLAFVCTIAANFAGLQICRQFISLRTTGNISSLPFIGGFLCTSLWLQYGLLINDSIQIGVNTLASLLQCAYIFCFYIYTDHKKWLFCQLFPVLGFISVLFYYVSYSGTEREFLVNTVGILACFGSITACSAPMASAKEVLRRKDTSALPFPIILATFIVTSLWLWYAVLISDKFLLIPNLTCAVLSGLQLSLFIIYPRKR